MIRPLIGKELREHRWVLLALWLVGALLMVGFLRKSADEGTPLMAFLTWTYSFGSLSILALTNRLVVREYSGRTQLFLETLPVGRGQVTAVKWLLGASLLMATMALGFAATLHVAANRVALNARFIELMAMRDFSFLLFAYALAFLIALTGRYRFVLWGALLIGAYFVDARAQLPMAQWPPVYLVSPSMVFERIQLPLRDLALTWLATALLLAATFALVLAGEGSLVVRLSQRMTRREAAAIGIAMIAVLLLVEQLDERKAKPPFVLHDAISGESGRARVAIAQVAGSAAGTARVLADSAASDLHGLQKYLSLTVLPGVSVLPDAAIDADVYQRAALPGSDGVVLRAAIESAHFDQQDFRAYALEQTLIWYTRGRALREQRRWLLDGFTQWWIARDSASRRERLGLRSALAAELLQSQGDSAAGSLGHWLSAREQLGDCLGDALAWRAVSLLADSTERNRFQDLMRAILGRRLPDDSRAAFLEPSLSAAWARSAAPGVRQLGATLQKVLQADAARLDTGLRERLHLPVEFSTSRMTGKTFEVHYRLGDKGPFAVRYEELEPWESELDRVQMARVDATGPGVLPRPFAPGTRLFMAIELNDPQAACVLRLGARRWNLQ